MAREVSGAGGESRSSRQGPIRLDRSALLPSRQILRIHPAVYEREELIFVGVQGGGDDAKTLALEVAAICNLPHRQNGLDLPRGYPGYYGGDAEPGQFMAIGESIRGQEGVAGDWNNPEREIRWEIAAVQQLCWQTHHGHAIGDTIWDTFH